MLETTGGYVNGTGRQPEKGVKFNPEDRAKIRTRIAQLLQEGKTQAEIKDVLNREGFTRPNGEPVSLSFVSNQRNLVRKGLGLPRQRQRRRRRSRTITLGRRRLAAESRRKSDQPAVSRPKAAGSRITPELVLQDVALSTEQKLAILKILMA